MKWVNKYFGDIPAGPAIEQPDISEPRQLEEKRLEKIDKLAPQPALGFAYHVPEKGTPEWHAMVVIHQILLGGKDSRIYQSMVQDKGYGTGISGGINWPLGNPYNYDGPMLWSASIVHGDEFSSDEIIKTLDEEVSRLQETLVSQVELDRAMTKIRSGLYDTLGDGNRIGLVDLLATAALFDDDPSRVNSIVSSFDNVTPELIQETAREFLRSTNRSTITLKPGKGEK